MSWHRLMGQTLFERGSVVCERSHASVTRIFFQPDFRDHKSGHRVLSKNLSSPVDRRNGTRHHRPTRGIPSCNGNRYFVFESRCSKWCTAWDSIQPSKGNGTVCLWVAIAVVKCAIRQGLGVLCHFVSLCVYLVPLQSNFFPLLLTFILW